MVIPSFSSAVAGSVLPRLAMDFTTDVLDSRVGLTRALNTATRVNSNGFIETVNADLPRFDYDPIALTAKGLLVEEQRANVFTYSSDLTNPVWIKGNASVANDSTTSPDGTLNADKLVEDTATSVHGVTVFTPTAATAYAISFYAKQSGRSRISFSGGGFAGQGFSAIFDIANGTMAVNTGSKGAITAVGNGWYRCVIVFTTTNTVQFGLAMANNSNATTYAGDGTSGIFIWGLQIEVGASATSYIPTNGASATRNADVAAVTGSNFSGWWQPTTGGMLVRASQISVSGTRPWAYISDGTANNIISLRGNAADPELYIKATTDQAQIDAGTLVSNTKYNLIGAWNTNDCAAALNGGTVATDTSAIVPSVDRMLIGSDGTNYINGWIEKVSYWPLRITNAETQAFSK